MDPNHPVTIIGIAGPSCAGKSTVIRILRQDLECAVMPLDHFFRKKAPGTVLGYDNWEIRESLMFDRFAACLHQLRQHIPVSIPRDPWTEDFSLTVEPHELVIAEGFILFMDDAINDLLDLNIYIDIPEETALRRRLQRDGEGDRRYIEHVVIPVFRMYRAHLLSKSHIVLDGDQPPHAVANELKKVIEEFIHDGKKR